MPRRESAKVVTAGRDRGADFAIGPLNHGVKGKIGPVDGGCLPPDGNPQTDDYEPEG